MEEKTMWWSSRKQWVLLFWYEKAFQNYSVLTKSYIASFEMLPNNINLVGLKLLQFLGVFKV